MKQDPKPRLIIHPLCPTSKSLLLDLYSNNYLDRVDYVFLDDPRYLDKVKAFPWAVPMLIIDDNGPVAMDPLDYDELYAIIEESYDREINDEDQFKISILYSSYASSISLLYGSVEPLISKSFLYPALRIKIRDVDYDETVRNLKSKATSIYNSFKEKIARALAITIVRHFYYSGITDPDELEKYSKTSVVNSIIFSLSSVGRVNLPTPLYKPDMAEYISEFISRNPKGLLRKIEREHYSIIEDKDYMRLVERLRTNQNKT